VPDRIANPFQPRTAGQLAASGSVPAGVDDLTFMNPYIAPGLTEEASFLMYKNQVQYIEDNEVVRHKNLRGTASEISPAAAPRLGVKTWSRSTEKDCIQVVSGASPKIRLVGFGIRMGFHVQPPRAVATADGVPLVQTRATISENAVIGNIQGILIYRTDWDIEYMLQSVPETLPSAGAPEAFADPTVAAPLGGFFDGGDFDLSGGEATNPVNLGAAGAEFQQGIVKP